METHTQVDANNGTSEFLEQEEQRTENLLCETCGDYFPSGTQYSRHVQTLHSETCCECKSLKSHRKQHKSKLSKFRKPDCNEVEKSEESETDTENRTEDRVVEKNNDTEDRVVENNNDTEDRVVEMFKSVKENCPVLEQFCLLMTSKDVVGAIAQINLDKDVNIAQEVNNKHKMERLKQPV